MLLFSLCGFFFFFSEWKSLRLKSSAEEGEKKIHRVRCVLPLPRKGWTSRDPFFPLLLFSRALSPSSLLPSRRVAAGSRALFLGRLCPPPPPHPSTFPPYGQAAEQRLGREGKQREANKPTPLAERGRLLSNLQAAAAAKLVGKSRFRFAFPRSEQELVTVPWISSFFHPPPIFFFLPLLFLFHSALKKKKIWKNDTLVSSPATLQQRREGGREGKREKGGEGGEKERKRREERERRSLSALRIPCESVLCVHQIVWMCCGLQGSWSLLDWLFDAFGPIVWLHRRGFDRSSGRGTEPSYKKKVSETVTLQQSITSTPCRVNMST